MDPISLIFIEHSSVLFLLDSVLVIYIFQESFKFYVIFIYCQKFGHGILLSYTFLSQYTLYYPLSYISFLIQALLFYLYRTFISAFLYIRKKL